MFSIMNDSKETEYSQTGRNILHFSNNSLQKKLLFTPDINLIIILCMGNIFLLSV